MQRPFTRRTRYYREQPGPLRNFLECAAAMLICITVLMLITFN